MVFLKMTQKENDYNFLCLLTPDIPHCTPPLTMSKENSFKQNGKTMQFFFANFGVCCHRLSSKANELPQLPDIEIGCCLFETQQEEC